MAHRIFKTISAHLNNFKGKVRQLKSEKNTKVPKKKEIEKNNSLPVSKVEITISSGTIAKVICLTILLLVLALFIYEIRDILIIFFIALFLSAALDPMVDSLQKRKIPRAVGVLLIYAVAFLILGFFISNLVPIIANELSRIAINAQGFVVRIIQGDIVLPQFLEGLRPRLQSAFEGFDVSIIPNYKDVLLQAAQKLSNVAGNVFNAISGIFNGFFNTALILVLTFLMVVDDDGINSFLLSMFPSRHADYIKQKSNAIKEKMGYWLRGQAMLMVAVGILVYIGFLIIGFATNKPVDYAATIALVAGLTELIPYAGPFVAWAIAMPIVANQSIPLILWMTILMYVVQLLENNVLVPLIMKKAVGLSPIFVMFSMFVGFQFLGIVGMVLAVPVATAVAIFIKDYADKEK